MNKGLYLKAQSVAFTGHRTIPVPLQGEVRRRLKATVSLAYANGNRRFLCGMTIGFDSLGAEAVLSLKEDLPNLRLVVVSLLVAKCADGVPSSGSGIISYSVKRMRWWC